MRLKANNACFVEVAYAQAAKFGQHVAGDVFLSRTYENNGRLIAALSDGLGSGVKANVLATLTTTMAVAFTADDDDYTSAAELIMKTLPISKDLKIAYSTFSIVDIDAYGFVKVFEYECPNYLLLRNGEAIINETTKTKVKSDTVNARELRCSKFKAQAGDRIVICTDGVTQSGMGISHNSRAWGENNFSDYSCKLIKDKPSISAKDFSTEIVNISRSYDELKPKDDITCATIYFRTPRNLLVVTGPPMSPERDKDMARIFAHFEGKKAICGGTTSKIIAREMKTKIEANISKTDSIFPPTAKMAGAEIITEGALTLEYALAFLEDNKDLNEMPLNGATSLIKLILESDSIIFLIGTKINQANMAPNLPIELDLKKNVVRRITTILENKFLKETEVRFI